MHQTPKDVFLSHASSDKENFVRPFARELREREISYWLDEGEVKWGDRLGEKLNEGMSQARYVVVFLSSDFLGNRWPEAELSAALGRENSDGMQVVLPILIADEEAIFARYPLLRGKYCLRWDLGVSSLVAHLERLLHSLGDFKLPSAKASESVREVPSHIFPLNGPQIVDLSCTLFGVILAVVHLLMSQSDGFHKTICVLGTLLLMAFCIFKSFGAASGRKEDQLSGR